MGERQAVGVQELPPQAEAAGGAVLGVAGNRMPDRLQVDTDLVRAPRLEGHPQQGRILAERALHREARARLAGRVGVGRHLRADPAVPPDRRIDESGARRWDALDQRQVLSLDRAPRHRAPERLVGLLSTSEDEQARGVAVEAMDDAWPLWIRAAGDAAGKRVDQRRAGDPG